MNDILWIFGIVFFVIFVLPITAYLIMKFGATGFYRARERNQKKKDK